MRGGGHDGYSRLVFEWPAPVSYVLKKEGEGAISIEFAKPASFDPSGFDPRQTPQIRTLSRNSADGEPLRVKVTIPDGAVWRDFTIGGKVIVDVFAPGGEKKKKPEAVAAAKPEKRPEKVPEKNAAVEKKAAEKKKDPEPPPQPEKTENPQAVAAKPVEKVEVAKLPPAAVEAHAILIALTEKAGMAVFVRDGRLWLVLDKPGINVYPQIRGPKPEMFGAFAKHDLPGGVVYVSDLPGGGQGLRVFGEGGGLTWRVIVTPRPRNTNNVKFERKIDEKQGVRGGTLIWSLSGTGEVLDVPDPYTGETLKVVTVRSAGEFGGERRDFVELTALSSPVGLALRPRVDDLEVKRDKAQVSVSRPGGLVLSRDKDINRRMMREEAGTSILDAPLDPDLRIRRIFDFDRWIMGGIQALGQNQHILMSAISEKKDKTARVQDILTLAKMNIANDRGQEAAGLLAYAEQEVPEILQSPEFIALRGAADALAGKYELALQDFQTPALRDYTETDYWRSFALAWLGDWRQAREAMPKDYTVLVGYPQSLLEKIGLKLAEVALRNGDTDVTDAILGVLERNRDTLRVGTRAGIDYLKGESRRQSGANEEAVKIWSGLADGKDDWYHARAGLALTILELQTKQIKIEDAIDRLEGLRYAWRGDELEAQINFTLGKLYIDSRKLLKGFGILRDAAHMSPESDVGEEVASYMAEKFNEIIMKDQELTPLDAVALYEEFPELTPAGPEGNALVQRLAERVIEADLLERAAGILQHQVDYRLVGMEKARVAKRLAAVYLLDKVPQKAIGVIDTAQTVYRGEGSEESQRHLHDLELMRARALSQMNKKEEALTLLSNMEPAADVNSLRADIAWQAGLWEDAAEALDDMILDQALDLNRPLTDKQAELILNRAVALNLSGNRVALVNMRKRYLDNMKKTNKGNLFDVVTRPRNTTLLADRDTLQSLVAEVDIFKDFLESYRGGEKTQ